MLDVRWRPCLLVPLFNLKDRFEENAGIKDFKCLASNSYGGNLYDVTAWIVAQIDWFWPGIVRTVFRVLGNGVTRSVLKRFFNITILVTNSALRVLAQKKYKTMRSTFQAKLRIWKVVLPLRRKRHAYNAACFQQSYTWKFLEFQAHIPSRFSKKPIGRSPDLVVLQKGTVATASISLKISPNCWRLLKYCSVKSSLLQCPKMPILGCIHRTAKLMSGDGRYNHSNSQ